MENEIPLFQREKTVINILAVACLWYPVYVYHPPDRALKKLNEALWTLWSLNCHLRWEGSRLWT